MGFSFVSQGLENQSLNHSSVPGRMSCFFMSSPFSFPVTEILLPGKPLYSCITGLFLIPAKNFNSSMLSIWYYRKIVVRIILCTWLVLHLLMLQNLLAIHHLLAIQLLQAEKQMWFLLSVVLLQYWLELLLNRCLVHLRV